MENWSEAHLVPRSTGIGRPSLEVKCPGRKTLYPLPPNNRWSYTSTPWINFMACLGTSLFCLCMYTHTHTRALSLSLSLFLSLFPYLHGRGSMSARWWSIRTETCSSFLWHYWKFVVFYSNAYANIIASQHIGMEFIFFKCITKVSLKGRKRIIQGRNVYTIKTESSNTPLCKLRRSLMKFWLKVMNCKRNGNCESLKS